MRHRRQLLLLLASAVLHTCCLLAQALRPSTTHPHYFERDGKPVILVGASDHFGSVMNGGFDDRGYLDIVSADGLNIMRVMSGVFSEPGQDGNSMEVLPGKPLTVLLPVASTLLAPMAVTSVALTLLPCGAASRADSLASGCADHTYGASGLFQINRDDWNSQLLPPGLNGAGDTDWVLVLESTTSKP